MDYIAILQKALSESQKGLSDLLFSQAASNFGGLLTGIAAILALVKGWRSYNEWLQQRKATQRAECASRVLSRLEICQFELIKLIDQVSFFSFDDWGRRHHEIFEKHFIPSMTEIKRFGEEDLNIRINNLKDTVRQLPGWNRVVQDKVVGFTGEQRAEASTKLSKARSELSEAFEQICDHLSHIGQYR